MADIVIDTHILADILEQYDPKDTNKEIKETKHIDKKICQFINQKIDNEGNTGYVFASSIAIIEIANQFDKISKKGKFNFDRFKGFVEQNPDWFRIENLSIDVVEKLIEVPKFTNRNEPVENPDAIHVATAFLRGNNTIFATSDKKLLNLSIKNILII